MPPPTTTTRADVGRVLLADCGASVTVMSLFQGGRIIGIFTLRRYNTAAGGYFFLRVTVSQSSATPDRELNLDIR